MSQWLEELFRELHPRATLEEIEGDIKQKPQRRLPAISPSSACWPTPCTSRQSSWWADAERPGRGAIEVDLVLDVGNSRPVAC